MAIKLEIFLKRTDQTLESWIDGNEVRKPDDLLPRCAYVGLSASPADVAAVKEIFKLRNETKAVEKQGVEVKVEERFPAEPSFKSGSPEKSKAKKKTPEQF